MSTHCARICWNSQGWVFPTGEAKALEAGSYVTKAGFGHEEWLFNFAWLVDGYHYAFLQPVSKSLKSVAGKTLDILLYSVNPNRDRVYVGELNNCEVLKHAQAQDALNLYAKNGWLESMKQQISAVSGHPARLDADAVFNIRFKPELADLYTPLRVARPTDLVTKLNRYTLAAVNAQAVTQWRRRKGTHTPPSIQTISRSGHPGVVYDPIHAALQGELLQLLKTRFGEGNVVIEADFVDITITDGKKKILVEIKSHSDARLAIREALGQILEYAYFNPELKNEDAELVILAPGPLKQNVSDYLTRLKARFGIPVTYCTFSSGEQLPPVF